MKAGRLTTAIAMLVATVTYCSAQDACAGVPTDVIFLLDASMPADADFQTALSFVEGVTAKFAVSVYDTKIALVKFGMNYRKIFTLATFKNRDDVLQAIRGVTRNGHTNYYSDLGDALSYTKSQLITTYYGRRIGANLVVVIVTSKTDSIAASVQQNAQALKNNGATIYAIGIGPLIPASVLTTMATDDQHKFPVAGFGALAALQDVIVNEICPAPLTTAAGPVVTMDHCPPGVPRDEHLQVHNGMCYQFVTYRARDFFVAERECELSGGTLVIIKDASTDLFIYNELVFTYKVHAGVWIGLRDIDNNPHFKWVDGSEVTYTNFNTGSSSGQGQQCVAMDVTISGSGQWRAGYPCDSSWDVNFGTLNYVCQFHPIIPASSSTTFPKTTYVSTTPAPTTIAPTTSAPATIEPTTSAPTTIAPTTSAPTTVAPTAIAPTTYAPTTIAPTISAPTTIEPTTSAPTTVAPITIAPTKSASTTIAPTTSAPTTSAPTTSAPTTVAPTTSAPTPCPAFTCNLDCGMDGYTVDTSGCSVCKCG